MYGSSSYPWKAIHRGVGNGGVGGSYPMYHPQTTAGVAYSAPMYGQDIHQTVSTDSQTDANKDMKEKEEVKLLKKLKDEIKDEVKGMKGMIAHLLIQNKELIKQNAELIEKIKN